MTIEALTEQIKQKFSDGVAINAKVKFNLGDDGIIFIDATQDPPILNHNDEDADVTLSCSIDIFKGLLDGTQDPNIAFMMGKLKIQGNMALALKLNSILED